MSRLREAWSNPSVRELLERVLAGGMFRGEPALADALLAEIDALRRSPLPDDAIPAALHGFLFTHHSAAFTRAFGHDEDARVRRRVSQIVELVGSAGVPHTFADFGCGDGRVTAGLARAWGLPPEQVFGIDVFNRVTEPAALTYIPLTAGRTPLPDAAADLAALLMVLHHEADPAGLLAEVARVLRPGGRLVVRESDVGTPGLKLFNAVMEDLYFRVFRRLPGVPVPDRHRGAAEWEALFRAAGFELLGRGEPEPDSPFTPVHFLLGRPAGERPPG